MPQHFLCALTLTATLTTTLTALTTMAHERRDHDSNGSKLTLPRFDPNIWDCGLFRLAYIMRLLC